MWGKTYQCQISNAGGDLSVWDFPWLLMIFQSSTTFHDFSRKFIFPGFPDPVGTLVIAFSREIYRQFTLVVLLIYILLTIIDDIFFSHGRAPASQLKLNEV